MYWKEINYIIIIIIIVSSLDLYWSNEKSNYIQ